MKARVPVAIAALLLTVLPAHAVRFSLGAGITLLPLSVDAGALGDLRLGLRPVLEVEPSPYFAVGVYTPFTLVRTGNGAGSGAESIFGLGFSLRRPVALPELADEALLYVTGRPGLGTADGRAGLFLGAAVGLSVAWLDSGFGLYAELEGGHVGIKQGSVDRPFAEVDRWLFGLSVGVSFKLAGEDWKR